MNTSVESLEKVRDDMVSLVEKFGALIRGLVGPQAEKAPEASETQEAQVAVTETAASAEAVKHNGKAERKGAKANQSDLVRSYMKKHPGSRNKEIIEMIKKDHGVEVNPSLVSFLRGKERKGKKVARAKVGRPAATSRMVSGSSLIREYLEKHPSASNEEVVKELKSSRKIKVRPTLVSSVRAILKRKGFKTSRISSGKVLKIGKARKGLPMPALVVKVLEKAGLEGMRLSEMKSKVIKAGYEYRGSKGENGVRDNVYQAVHALSKTIPHAGYEGKTPVVLHDLATKKWKLNPKAVKREVA